MREWLFPAKLNWRGHIARLYLYFQLGNSAIALPAAVLGVMGGTSGWLKIFGVSTELSLLTGVLLGLTFFPCAMVGGWIWAHKGFFKQSQEVSLIEGLSHPELLRLWLLWRIAERQGINLQHIELHTIATEVQHVLASSRKEEA